MAKKLTAKERAFVERYLVDGNATQAAIRAGYSAKTAAAIASENLRKPHIADAIETARKPLSDATIADATERRQRLSVIARTSENVRAVIAAIDGLNKMDGVYVVKNEHSGPKGAPIPVVVRDFYDARSKAS